MSRRSLLLLLILTCPLNAEEVQPGKVYSGGARIESSALGVAFTIPDGWQGGWPPGSSAFVLDNDAGTASIMMVFDQFSQSQIATMMAENIPLDENVYLAPTAMPVHKSDYYQNHYQVMGSVTRLNGFIAAKVLREGLSLATIIMSADISDPQQQVVVNLTTGLALSEPQTAPQDTGASSWQAYMKGRYIARFYSGSGYHEKQELWLCSDGSFASSFNSGGFSMDGFSGAVSDGNTGQWQATGNINQPGRLQLTYANGNQTSFQLQLQDKLYLDGEQWLRGDNERCY